MYEFWYDYIKSKYKDKAKLCYMDTDSFIIHIETEDFYEEIADDLKNGLIHQTTVKMIKGHFQQAKARKKLVFSKMNRGKITKEFFGLRGKAYAYLMDDDSENKIAKGTKRNEIKRENV